MHDPKIRPYLDARAFSPLLRGVSVIASTIVMAGVVLSAFAAAAGIVSA
jgi:hypothetical protein